LPREILCLFYEEFWDEQNNTTEDEVAMGDIGKRFATIAMEREFVTIEQVAEALKIQIIEDMGTLSHRLIGKILLDLGYLTSSQHKEVLDAMDIISEEAD
jgi:hypothetical protein